MRAFVTGLDGFAGQWLARELLSAGDTVAGGSHSARPSFTILNAGEADRIEWFRFDLLDGSGLDEALQRVQPDAAYHLAAQASARASLDHPLETYDLNVIGTARLLDACRRIAPAAAILYVGSSDAYGNVPPSELPVKESRSLQPLNPYAASKAAGEILALQHARATGARLIATRSFNHTGPGQRDAFAVPSFAKQATAIALRSQPPVIRAGNLDVRRDFSDVRDVVRAYRMLITSGKAGHTYNVASGKSVTLRSVVEELLNIAGVEARIETEAGRTRNVDIADLSGDTTALRGATGWEPHIPLRRTLTDLYDFELRGAKGASARIRE